MADKDTWKYLVKIPDILPEAAVKALDKAMDSLATALNFLTKVLKLLQFFISSFSSFSMILQTFINFASQQISQFTGNFLNTGVYYNILIPPSFLKSLYDSKNSAGGFEGFLTRLKVSLNNPADKNAPVFTPNGIVGGFIVICDSETLIDIWKGLQFLAGMFDFFKLFPINIEPLPPANVRAVSGYFEVPAPVSATGTSSTILKLGVKITWDAPRTGGFTNYRISRSQKPGGIYTIEHPVPTKLIGPKGHENEGLLKAAQYRFASGAKEWPPVDVYAYNDPTFNKGKPVIVRVNPVNGGGGYLDLDVPADAVANQKSYYYVIESGFSPLASTVIGAAATVGGAVAGAGVAAAGALAGEAVTGAGVASGGLWGPRTPETSVAVNLKGCISPDTVGVIPGKEGGKPGTELEFVSIGAPSLGMWSTVKVGIVIPFLDTVVGILNKFLAGLAGALKTNTKSFVDFLNGLAEKVNNYKDILTVLIEVITAIENFFTGAPRIAFLNLPPAIGGTTNFIQRVTNAVKPAGGFSGSTGTTVGVVFVYGLGTLDTTGMSQEQAKVLEAELKLQSDALGKAFGLLIKALT